MKLFKPTHYDSQRFRKALLLGSLTFAIGLSVLFSGIKVWISYEANAFAKEAKKTFQMNKTEALVALIESDNYSLKDKNKAVWALGVRKDKKALDKLESLVTGKECNHSEEVCQREVTKAIAKINGNTGGVFR